VLGDPREARLDPREKRRVAVHEAGHAVVAYYSSDSEPLHRVSILPRGMALGVTQQTPAADRHLMTEAELRARLRVLMGGHCAERTVFADVSTGAENDLKEATRIASKMVANYGMSKTLGPAYYEHQSEHPFLGQRMGTDGGTSDATVFAIEREARGVLATALSDARDLLTTHRGTLDRLVLALLERETLEQHELLEVLAAPLDETSGQQAVSVAVAPAA
jgi:cell division protease FtsH